MTEADPSTVVFTVGATQYCVADVVDAARAWGDLADITEGACQGLACLKRATGDEDLPTPEEIEAAAAEFRYARDLITADEALAWLNAWGLTVEDWTEYLQRTLLRDRWASELPDTVSRYPVGSQELEARLHAEGVCSGAFGRVASNLAGQVAAWQRAREEGWLTDDDGGGGRPMSLAQLDEALGRLRAHAVTPAAIRAEVAARHLDWVRLECDSAWFPDIHRAREALLCVRDDGRELEQVAADARARLDRRRLYLEQTEPAWRDHLLGARAGDVVGPLSQDDGFVVVLVRDKALPDASDDEIRRQAEASVLRRAIDYEVANRVKWHLRT